MSGKEPRFLTAKQVAARYGRSLKWVYENRTIPRRKIGKFVMFREDELDAWERRRVPMSRWHNPYRLEHVNMPMSHNASKKVSDNEKLREDIDDKLKKVFSIFD